MNLTHQMSSVPRSILVWDLPTRLFHWALAISFAVAYLTAESDTYAVTHQLSGYLLLSLIGFRLVWGFLGSRYSRFSEFIRSPATTLSYMRAFFKSKPAHYIGHNPLGAIAIVLMLVLGAGIGITGWLNVSAIGGEAFEDFHALLANMMLGVVVLHIAGVIASSITHRANLAKAMVTGYKPGPAEAGINSSHGMIAVLLIAALALFSWSLTQGKLPMLLDPSVITADRGDGNAAGLKGDGDKDD